ncbi:MAG TPA: protein-methionine-sulfoxide reductase heme-binding subunit MsrQ [Acetobacteraceae bacterium]|nr:protein-methionine-sulfoxide reductase heme-binding subunit MsrQ [Acetobacteraceae bacterium]
MTQAPMTRRRPMKLPWRDRAGRLAPFKLAVFAALFVPGLVLAAQFATGSLGARPLNAVIHGTGLWTIRLLLVALAVTPARAVLDWQRLPLVRRMLGVGALAYGLTHFTLYSIDQNGHMLHVAAEIIHRFYLTIGFTALLGIVALGITSTDASVRRMGKNWKRLHWLAYPIGVLAVFHATLQSKVDVSEAMVMAGCFVWLMLWRLLPVERQRRPLALVPLAGLASAATAGLEYTWYALATRIPAERVLAANLDFEDGLRPAAWVLIAAFCIAVLAVVRNHRRSVVRPA